jgi:hypothetical protein
MVDDVGVELADGDAARKQVWNTLPAMAAHRQLNGNMACQLRMACAMTSALSCSTPP